MGNSKDIITSLSMVNIDLNNHQFIQKAFNLLEERISMIESLIKNKE